MTDLGKAYVQIVPSAKGISGSITEALGGEVDAAGTEGGTSLGKKIGSFAMKAFAAAEVGKFITDTIKEGARYEQAVGGIETLFKGSADKMKAYANEAYKTAGISANEYMEQATSFASRLLRDTGGDTEKTAELVNLAIKDMSDNANKMGTNITDIQNAYQGLAKGNATMLDNLKIGYGGTQTEALQLAKDMGIVEESVKSFNDMSFEDAILAIHKMQEQLEITGTTALEGSTTISGSFEQMKAAAHNFMAQLVAGEDVSGAMEGLIDSAVTFGGNLGKALLKVLENLPEAVGTLFGTLTDKLKEVLENEDSRAKLVEGAQNFIVNFGKGLVKAIPKILEFVVVLLGVLLQAVIDWQMSLLQKVLDFLSGTLLPAIQQKWEDIKAAIVERVKAMVEAVKTWFDNMKEAISNKVTSIRQNVIDKFQNIKASISQKASEMVSTVKDKFQAIKDGIQSKMEAARDKVKSIIDKIKGFFNFKVSLPHIPLPHFSVSPAGWKIGDLLKGSIPSLSVRWYAQGGIFNKPTVLSGLGDNGPEAALPLDPFWQKMDAWGNSIINGMALLADGLQTDGDITIETYLYPNGPKMDEYTVKSYDRGKKRLG